VTLQFLQPSWLWLLVPLWLLTAVAARRLRGEESGRIAALLLFRIALLTVVVIAIAQPMLSRLRDDVAVVAVVDVSGSVRRLATAVAWGEGDRAPLARAQEWLDAAVALRGRDDRFGVVVFDNEQSVLATPTRLGMIDDSIDRPMSDGTDIGAALRLARALFPADASRRLLLISDGNETRGSALEAATAAAADPRGPISIDVLPIIYRLQNEVQIVRIEAPTTARTGQTVTLRIVMDSTGPTSGRLIVTHEGQIVDLDPDGPDTSRRIDVPEGFSVALVSVPIDGRPLHRFAAIFEPDDPADDTLAENNRGETLVTNAGANAVLLVRGRDRIRTPSAYRDLLEAAQLPVTITSAEGFPNDLLGLQAFDLIILDDVGAHEVELHHQEMLAEYVDRLGGGLLVTGGPNSFGAGGWRGSPIESVLPLNLDVPRQLQRPSAALVLVLDKSGSMSFPVAGARATQQEIANEAAAIAVESLSARSLVGVIAFDTMVSTIVPLGPNDDPDSIVAGIRSIRPGGGTNISGGLAAAERMLEGVDVEQRQIVFLTDGRSMPGQEREIATRLADAGVMLTTIGVGDDIDAALLRELAELGRGEFFMVRNPRSLPRVLVDSVRMVNRPLVREDPFVPLVRVTGTGLLAGLEPMPPLGGLVLTTPRPTPEAVIELSAPTGEPVLATWQAGLGRVTAFTSDLDGPWAGAWLDWAGWARLWIELTRRTARPALGAGLSISAEIHDDGLRVLVEVDPEADESIDPALLRLEGVVYGPRGDRQPLRLRQVAARRFEGIVRADEAGSHVVALSPLLEDRPLAPLVAAATRAAAEEYRASSSNLALLREIAESTGGRLLDWDDPASPALFDRRGLDPTFSIRPLWPLLAWLALALLIGDVAVRRIAWSPSRLRELAHEGFRWRRGEGARSVAAWLAESRQAHAPRRSSPSPQIEPPQRTGPRRVGPRIGAPLQAPPRTSASARSSASSTSSGGASTSNDRPVVDREAQRRALRELAGERPESAPLVRRKAGDRDATPSTTPNGDGQDGDGQNNDAGSAPDNAMDRLLAAKRRAQRRDDEEQRPK